MILEDNKGKPRKKVQEEVPGTSTAGVAGTGDDPIVAVDRRYRKDKLPKLLKRFRGFMKDSNV